MYRIELQVEGELDRQLRRVRRVAGRPTFYQGTLGSHLFAWEVATERVANGIEDRLCRAYGPDAVYACQIPEA